MIDSKEIRQKITTVENLFDNINDTNDIYPIANV